MKILRPTYSPLGHEPPSPRSIWPLLAWLVVLLGLMIAATLFLVARSRPAHAHGEAAWIQAGGYHDRKGMHCCGEHDCRPVPASELTQDGTGISYGGRKLFYGPPDGVRGGIYHSAEPDPAGDQRYWVCALVIPIQNTIDLRCIFIPFQGY